MKHTIPKKEEKIKKKTAKTSKVKKPIQISDKLRNLPVNKKLKSSFTRVSVAFMLPLIIAVIGVCSISFLFYDFYSVQHANSNLQMEIRKNIQLVDKNLLWASTSSSGSETKSKLANVVNYSDILTRQVSTLTRTFDEPELIGPLSSTMMDFVDYRVMIQKFVNEDKKDMAFALYEAEYSDTVTALESALTAIGDAADHKAE